jgi:hypothetical protein
VLVATVVTGTRVALGILVGHGGAQSIEDGAGCDILRSDKQDGLALALDFFLLLEGQMLAYNQCVCRTYHDISNLLVRLHQGLLHELS